MWAAVNIAKKNLENTFAFALHDSEGVCRAGRVQGWSAPSCGLDCVGDKLSIQYSYFFCKYMKWFIVYTVIFIYTRITYVHVTFDTAVFAHLGVYVQNVWRWNAMQCGRGGGMVLWACVPCPITLLTGVTINHAPDTGLHPAHPAHTTPPSIYVSINLHKVTKIYLLSIFCPV